MCVLTDCYVIGTEARDDFRSFYRPARGYRQLSIDSWDRSNKLSCPMTLDLLYQKWFEKLQNCKEHTVRGVPKLQPTLQLYLPLQKIAFIFAV